MCREQDATAQQDATEAVNTVMAHVQSERFVADLPHTSKAPSEHLLGGKRASYLYQALVAKSSKFPEKSLNWSLKSSIGFLLLQKGVFSKSGPLITFCESSEA